MIGSDKAPFAVESGGHTSNPGFSSTTGVHISMTRLKQLQFSADNSTLELGMGWVSDVLRNTRRIMIADTALV